MLVLLIKIFKNKKRDSVFRISFELVAKTGIEPLSAVADMIPPIELFKNKK